MGTIFPISLNEELSISTVNNPIPHLHKCQLNSSTKKTGSQGCVGKGIIFFTNIRSGTPARRQMTLENCVYSGHWLTHVGVVFQASMNSRVLLVVPFPTAEALVQSNAWPAVRQCRVRREFSSCRLTAL